MLGLRGSGLVKVLAVVFFPHRSHGGLVVPSRRQHPGLIVVLLCGREAVVAEQGRGHANVFGIFDGDGGRRAVAEEVRRDGGAKGSFRAPGYTVIDAFGSHAVAVDQYPQAV